MTNKTEMVSVPRELLERLLIVAAPDSTTERPAWYVDDLHALLAAPAEDVRAVVVEETLFQKGQRLAKEGHGLSNLWGNCAKDSDMDEVQRGMEAYWQSQ